MGFIGIELRTPNCKKSAMNKNWQQNAKALILIRLIIYCEILTVGNF